MIRKATEEDFEHLLNLLHQLSPLSEKDKTDSNILKQILNKIIQDENQHLFVYEENNIPVGTGTLLIQLNLSHGGKPTAHIENVVVHKEHRKKGIGKKLINHLIQEAKNKKCYKVILNCKKENIPFYNNCNLKETGEVEMRLDL